MIRYLLPLLLFASLTACSDGSSSSSDLRTGRFLDSAVQGLAYQTPTMSGVTDQEGMFTYRSGETVVFSIGELALPDVAGAPIVTALDVFNTRNPFALPVVNLNRLLQTLDANGDPTDGIDLTELDASSTEGLQLNFARNDFDTQVVNLVANSGGVSTALISSADASAHFEETLQANGLGDSGCSSDHPAVGRIAQFSTLAHDVVGTVEVIDDCTLEVTGFGYDGGGPNVFFYTGIDGDFRGPEAQITGPRLDGQIYRNDRFTLPLPSGLTLDDVNSLSVWCIDFRASFGTAIFNR